MNEQKIYSPCGPDCRRFAHEGGASCVVLDDGRVAGPVRARDHVGSRWDARPPVVAAAPVAGDQSDPGVSGGPGLFRRVLGRLGAISDRIDDWIDGLVKS